MNDFKQGDHVVVINDSSDSAIFNNFVYVVIAEKENSVFVKMLGAEIFYEMPKYQIEHATLEEIAAEYRNDKTPLMQHLDKCEEVVKTWPKWKLESIRDAFGIPVLDNDMGDDSHIENHVSPLCKMGVK